MFYNSVHYQVSISYLVELCADHLYARSCRGSQSAVPDWLGLGLDFGRLAAVDQREVGYHVNTARRESGVTL